MGVFAPRKKCRSFISDPSRRWFAAIFKQVPFLPWYSPIRRFDTGRREVPVKRIKKRRETVGGGDVHLCQSGSVRGREYIHRSQDRRVLVPVLGVCAGYHRTAVRGCGGYPLAAQTETQKTAAINAPSHCTKAVCLISRRPFMSLSLASLGFLERICDYRFTFTLFWVTIIA